MTLQEIEKKYIKRRLNRYKDKTKVASSLGISLGGLYNKIEDYKLDKFIRVKKTKPVSR